MNLETFSTVLLAIAYVRLLDLGVDKALNLYKYKKRKKQIDVWIKEMEIKDDCGDDCEICNDTCYDEPVKKPVKRAATKTKVVRKPVKKAVAKKRKQHKGRGSLMVRTPGFQPGNQGSIPCRATVVQLRVGLRMPSPKKTILIASNVMGLYLPH